MKAKTVSPVRSLPLAGLGLLEGQEIIKDKGLSGSDEAWNALINLYSGNPLALKLISEPIRELFRGEISRFLREGEAVLGDIREQLDQQFNRLSKLELEIMYWLAIEREPVALEDIHNDLVRPISRGELLEAFDALRKRSMIESRTRSAPLTLPVWLINRIRMREPWR